MGRARSMFQPHIKESGGKERVMTVSLDPMRSPGGLSALITVSQPGTIIRGLKCVHHHAHLVLKGYGCIWTVLLHSVLLQCL